MTEQRKASTGSSINIYIFFLTSIRLQTILKSDNFLWTFLLSFGSLTTWKKYKRMQQDPPSSNHEENITSNGLIITSKMKVSGQIEKRNASCCAIHTWISGSRSSFHNFRFFYKGSTCVCHFALFTWELSKYPFMRHFIT